MASPDTLSTGIETERAHAEAAVTAATASRAVPS